MQSLELEGEAASKGGQGRLFSARWVGVGAAEAGIPLLVKRPLQVAAPASMLCAELPDAAAKACKGPHS